MEIKKTFMMDASLANKWVDTTKLVGKYEGIVRDIPVLGKIGDLRDFKKFEDYLKGPENFKKIVKNFLLNDHINSNIDDIDTYTIEAEWAIGGVGGVGPITTDIDNLRVKIYRYIDIKYIPAFLVNPYNWGGSSFGFLIDTLYDYTIKDLKEGRKLEYQIYLEERQGYKTFETDLCDFKKFPYDKIIKKIYSNLNLNHVEVINLGAEGCEAAYVNCPKYQAKAMWKAFWKNPTFNIEEVKQEAVRELFRKIVSEQRFFKKPSDLPIV